MSSRGNSKNLSTSSETPLAVEDSAMIIDLTQDHDEDQTTESSMPIQQTINWLTATHHKWTNRNSVATRRSRHNPTAIPLKSAIDMRRGPNVGIHSREARSSHQRTAYWPCCPYHSAAAMYQSQIPRSDYHPLTQKKENSITTAIATHSSVQANRNTLQNGGACNTSRIQAYTNENCYSLAPFHPWPLARAPGGFGSSSIAQEVLPTKMDINVRNASEQSRLARKPVSAKDDWSQQLVNGNFRFQPNTDRISIQPQSTSSSKKSNKSNSRVTTLLPNASTSTVLCKPKDLSENTVGGRWKTGENVVNNSQSAGSLTLPIVSVTPIPTQSAKENIAPSEPSARCMEVKKVPEQPDDTAQNTVELSIIEKTGDLTLIAKDQEMDTKEPVKPPRSVNLQPEPFIRTYRCQSVSSVSAAKAVLSQIRKCKKCNRFYSVACQNMTEALLSVIECPKCWNSNACYCGLPFSDRFIRLDVDARQASSDL